MQDLVRAAGAVSAQHGVPVTVMVFGGEPSVTASAVAVPAVPAPAELPAQAHEDHARIVAMGAQFTQVTAQRDTALQERDGFAQQLREAQASIAELRDRATSTTDTPPPPPPAAPANQPTAVVDYDALGIETLNLPEKVVKVCAKNEVATVGQLRAFFSKLGEHKINQKERLVVADALMGYISAPITETPAAPRDMGGAPAGFTDRPWADRLKIARFKEGKDDTTRERTETLLAACRDLIPDMPDPATVRGEGFFRGMLSALVSESTADKQEASINVGSYIAERLVHEVTNAQVAAVAYCLGFDPKDPQQRTVDGALTAHGLVHLVESVPAVAAGV